MFGVSDVVAVTVVSASFWIVLWLLSVDYFVAAPSVLLLLFASYISGALEYIRVILLTIRRDIRGAIFLGKCRRLYKRYTRDKETISTLFERTASRHPEKPAFIFENVTWTFKDVSVYSDAIAYYMAQRNLSAGDVVAIFMESRPECVANWVGVCKAGMVSALINHSQRKDTLLHSIRVANAKAIIVGEELIPAMAEICCHLERNFQIYVVPESQCPNSKNIANVIEPSCEECPVDGMMGKKLDLAHLRRFIEKGSFSPRPERSFQDTIMYIYTSGTTGLPKAAKITNHRFWYMTFSPHYLCGLSNNDVVYVTLPIYHSNGGILGIGQGLLFGCTVVLRQKFSASRFWDDCVQYGCTAFNYIGETCRYLTIQPFREAEKQHQVRVCFGNGMRANIWQDFVDRFRVKICEFYGSTEGNCNMLNNVGKVGSVGYTTRLRLPGGHRLHPILLIKVDESGQPLRTPDGLCVESKIGEEGELVGKISDKLVILRFEGYASEAETSKKIVKGVLHHGDVYFRSGDVLVMDELGFFYFKDRTGDTFRWRGENVSTAEVEAVVSSVTGLRDATVYGVTIPNVEGRAGMAAIVDASNDLDLAALAVSLKEKLPNYAQPMFLRLLPSIPATSTFKFVKTKLVEEGYNLSVIPSSDRLYYLDPATKKYVRIDQEAYTRIISGGLRL